MKPDVISVMGLSSRVRDIQACQNCTLTCIEGDYRVGETLLAESASAIHLAAIPAPSQSADGRAESPRHLSLPNLPTTLSNMFARSRTPSPEPSLTPLPPPPVPRRLVLVVVGLKPHRHL